MRLSPGRRALLDRLVREGSVKTAPRERPVALLLISEGFAELTPDGIVATDAGRSRWREEFEPRVHVDFASNYARRRDYGRVG